MAAASATASASDLQANLDLELVRSQSVTDKASQHSRSSQAKDEDDKEVGSEFTHDVTFAYEGEYAGEDGDGEWSDRKEKIHGVSSGQEIVTERVNPFTDATMGNPIYCEIIRRIIRFSFSMFCSEFDR
jgi:hypothetical protein